MTYKMTEPDDSNPASYARYVTVMAAHATSLRSTGCLCLAEADIGMQSVYVMLQRECALEVFTGSGCRC